MTECDKGDPTGTCFSMGKSLVYIHNRIRKVLISPHKRATSGSLIGPSSFLPHIPLSDWLPSNSWKIHDWSTQITNSVIRIYKYHDINKIFIPHLIPNSIITLFLLRIIAASGVIDTEDY